MADATSTTKRRRQGVWDTELEEFLGQAQAMLGPRGSSAAVADLLERGGPGVSSSSPHELCDDEQLGWGRFKGRSSIERYRALEPVWRAVGKGDQDILVAYYCTTRGTMEGEQPETTTGGIPKGVRAELVQLAGVAYLLLPPAEWTRLSAACQALNGKGHSHRKVELKSQAELRDEVHARCLAAVTAAHDGWAVVRRSHKGTQERAELVQKVSDRVYARMARRDAVLQFEAELNS